MVCLAVIFRYRHNETALLRWLGPGALVGIQRIVEDIVFPRFFVFLIFFWEGGGRLQLWESLTHPKLPSVGLWFLILSRGNTLVLHPKFSAWYPEYPSISLTNNIYLRKWIVIMDSCVTATNKKYVTNSFKKFELPCYWTKEISTSFKSMHYIPFDQPTFKIHLINQFSKRITGYLCLISSP